MNNDDLIIKARQFMVGAPSFLETGAEICASCGYDTAVNPVKKLLANSFNQVALLRNPSAYLCGRCFSLLKDMNARSKPVLWKKPGKYEILPRENVLGLLKEPPEEYVLCIPYSFQKHTFFYAGVSTKDRAYIGTDDKCVVLDYKAFDIPVVIDLIGKMLREGAPRREVENGVYSTFTRARYGKALAEWEKQLSPLRPDGGVELIVRYSPAVKNKMKKSYEGDNMWTDSEKTAIRLLSALAKPSNVRKTRAIDFWSNEFRRRLARFQEEKDLHVFFSKVAGSLQCGVTLDVSLIDEIDDSAAPEVMRDIRDKLDILIAAVYTAHKEEREIKDTLNLNGKKDGQNSFFD